MKINPLNISKDKWRFELTGEDHTFCNALRKELWNDKDVDVAGYHIEHDIVSEPIFIVEAKSNIKKVLVSAIDRLLKRNKEFLDKINNSL